ncbi:hypothetical protein NHP21005_02970 [Helicobacter sp. NHP21005]|uniref:hypothetical protein n=1 Tax=Helicobacter felistomachi TaxID=3040201 RepID=UPI0025725AA4|nr:hypothetical protein [Helicobacter sp. NHP21005]BEG56609.1 hypothetical protein NHP21005_02970 [Helicobacter sp. NHP21005]
MGVWGLAPKSNIDAKRQLGLPNHFKSLQEQYSHAITQRDAALISAKKEHEEALTTQAEVYEAILQDVIAGKYSTLGGIVKLGKSLLGSKVKWTDAPST